MEVSWLAECVVKLIQWKYGTVVHLQDLQNLEYDPGGTLCKCCRVLTAYSNTVVLIAMSFAVVTASGQYVHNGVSSYAAGNGSELYASVGTSVLPDGELALEASLEHVAVLPISTKVNVLSLFGDFSTVADRVVHISVSDNESADASVSLFNSSSSNATEVFQVVNDTQVPRFSNRTPHLIERDGEDSGYFGVLSVVLGLMILLTVVGKFCHLFISIKLLMA